VNCTAQADLPENVCPYAWAEAAAWIAGWYAGMDGQAADDNPWRNGQHSGLTDYGDKPVVLRLAWAGGWRAAMTAMGRVALRLPIAVCPND